MKLTDLDLSNIKVVVTDLDGTSITKDHQMLPYTAKVLTTLHNSGIKVIVATGRGKNRVQMVRDVLPETCPLVLSVGAIVERVPGLNYVKTMNSSFTSRFFPHFSKWDDLNIYAYTVDSVYANKVDGALFKGGKANLDTCPLSDVIKVFLYDTTKEHDRLAKIYDFIQAEFPGECTAVFSSPYALDITAPGVDKLNALKAILELDGLTPEANMLAFGDSFNDASMLYGAKYGFYMANTADFIKEQFEADGRLIPIGANHEEAMARTLNELFNLGIDYSPYAHYNSGSSDFTYDDGASSETND